MATDHIALFTETEGEMSTVCVGEEHLNEPAERERTGAQLGLLFTYPSRPAHTPCLSLPIDRWLQSLTPGLIYGSAAWRDGLWHSEGNVTVVSSETDTSSHTGTPGLPHSV